METVISGDETEIAFNRAGTGPPLVLVHGTASDHTDWRVVQPMLAETFTVYAIDRRGRGKGGDSDTYAIEREFEDIADGLRCPPDDIDVIAAKDEDGDPVHYHVTFLDRSPVPAFEFDALSWSIEETTIHILDVGLAPLRPPGLNRNPSKPSRSAWRRSPRHSGRKTRKTRVSSRRDRLCPRGRVVSRCCTGVHHGVVRAQKSIPDSAHRSVDPVCKIGRLNPSVSTTEWRDCRGTRKDCRDRGVSVPTSARF